MALTITNQAPNFFALTGTQPVGHKQIAVATDYAGSVTTLYRPNTSYWTVTTRSIQGAFTDRAQLGCSAAIWFDQGEGRYVVDYFDGFRIEAGRALGLRAAIGIAVDVANQRWAAEQAAR
jgi:hypothetical protein